jgi:hypothetical protein
VRHVLDLSYVAPGRVYVIAIGNSYAVLDPSYKYDPTSARKNWTVLVLDSPYRRLRLF